MAEKPENLPRRFAEVARRLAAIRDEIAPLERDAAKLRAAADKAETAWRAVREEIVALERKRKLADLSREHAQLARALGARGLRAESAR